MFLQRTTNHLDIFKSWHIANNQAFFQHNYPDQIFFLDIVCLSDAIGHGNKRIAFYGGVEKRLCFPSEIETNQASALLILFSSNPSETEMLLPEK